MAGAVAAAMAGDIMATGTADLRATAISIVTARAPTTTSDESADRSVLARADNCARRHLIETLRDKYANYSQ